MEPNGQARRVSHERLSTAAVVMLGRSGAVLPRSETHPEVVLSGADLVLLATLAVPEPVAVDLAVASVEAATGVERSQLDDLLARLDERDLLTERPASASPPPPSPPRTSAIDDAPRPELADDDSLVVGAPRALSIADGRFVARDHAGAIVTRLSPVDLAATVHITTGRTLAGAYEAHVAELGAAAGTRDAFDQLAGDLVQARILFPAAEVRSKSRQQAQLEVAVGRAMRTWAAVDVAFQAQLTEVIAEDDATGSRRLPVVPIVPSYGAIPLSLGMVVSTAQAFEGGRLGQDFAFLPACLMHPGRLARAIERDGIFLFSDYIWSQAENLDSSHAIKERNPRCVIVHGGPDAPKYPGDVTAYFEANPFIDVVVHGEGEATFAELLAALAPSAREGAADVRALADVAGLSYRWGDEVVRTADRDRLSDVNVIPSPYLAGFYDLHREGIDTAFIETNRGCPYGCTYCDWGSSTNSRIRKFDLDRVFAELEWCARAGVSQIYVADANFGIFERDVEIAQKVADLKREHGFPKTFQTNYAKNTVKHLQKIVSVLADEGIVTEGLLSLQSMDDDTLAAIRRSNIKVEKYDALASEFRQAELPLMVDLMIGLPGSTTASVRDDFQQCIDREINAKVFQTEVLINSPMNEPSYREEHAIVVERSDGRAADRVPKRGSAGGGRSLVVSSTSFTRRDYDEMLELRRAFLVAENFAVLRLVGRFLRQERGVLESDLFNGIRAVAYGDADRWPTISAAVRYTPEYMVPPVSWGRFMDEVGSYLIDVWGVEPSSALDAVLLAQHAVLPSPQRRFPHVVELPHDVGAWYRDVREAKDSGQRTTWTDQVPRLETYPATTFVVTDPDNICDVGMGFAIDADPYADWELESPVRRTHARHAIVVPDADGAGSSAPTRAEGRDDGSIAPDEQGERRDGSMVTR